MRGAPTVTEAMGIGDIAASLWGECPEKGGMHFSGRGLVHFELIDPDTGAPVPLADGAEGELVYTHLAQEAVPLLRFRSRDHVRLWTGRCACGRTAPRVRCIGRTDDMLIVRGVNVFPSALREIVGAFAPEVSGVISVRPRQRGFRQDPPLRMLVETGGRAGRADDLAERIRHRIREVLLVTTEIALRALRHRCRGATTSRSWSTGRKPARASSNDPSPIRRSFTNESPFSPVGIARPHPQALRGAPPVGSRGIRRRACGARAPTSPARPSPTAWPR